MAGSGQSTSRWHRLLRSGAWRRDDSWVRRKLPGEKWPRFTAEVPPELAELLTEAQRVSLGINWDGYKTNPTNASRANLVTAGLRLYLEANLPEQPLPIDSTAHDVIDLPAIEAPDA